MSLDRNTTMEHETLPILRNPFCVLGVSSRDNRQRIVQAAEERSLTLDADVCAKARADLTNPRNRLSAELAWLPGMSPRRIVQLVDELARNTAAIFKAEGLPPLAHANLLASAVFALKPTERAIAWVVYIIALSRAAEAISTETVLADINQDRTVAGFPEVKSIETIEEGLVERRREYRDCIRTALDSLPSQKLVAVVTEVVLNATEDGTIQPPSLIGDMIDAYAVGAHAFLSREAENIQLLVARARQAAPAGASAVSPLLQRLEAVVDNWYAVAKPIHLVARAKGTSHDLSGEVAGAVRDLGIFLYNEHSLLEASQRIVRLLQEAFGNLPEFAERVHDDARALDVLARKKENAEKTKPLVELCTEALKAIESSPETAESHGRMVLDVGKKLISALANDGVDRDTVAELQNIVAVTVLRSAVALGNASNKWEKPLALLEEARAITHDKGILGHIDSNLAVARQNHRLFWNLEPITSAPSLWTLNGAGFAVYGNTDPDAASGSYMTTYYFVFLFIPIFPICRYRVISTGNSYRFLGKAPLRVFDKWHLAVSLVACLIGFLLVTSSN